MERTKLTEQYDRKYISWTRNSYSEEKYGFSGSYTHKDLGKCQLYVTQDCRANYYLMLEVWINGIEYFRQFQCSNKPSYRLTGLKAREFLKDLRKIN